MNPFLNALKTNMARPKKKSEALNPAPRVLMLNHSDMPMLKKRRPGDKVTAHIRGVIHSVDQDGNVALHVDDVADPQVGFDKDKDGE